MEDKKKFYLNFPESPGVYIMKGPKGQILYIGKAGNLKKRVSSYFLRAHERRIEKLVSEIRSISYKRTDSALEALILEAELIKKNQPPYNVREKDDKSFLFIEITSEKYPRVLLVRGKDAGNGRRFGPFISTNNIREAMRILRRIFPWSIHPSSKVGKLAPCFDYQIGLCPGVCFGGIDIKEYKENINNLKLFLSGKKRVILNKLNKKMKEESKKLEFEKASRVKRQIFALKHIQDVSLIMKDEVREKGNKKQYRIEGYDISNISGSDAVGSMVVFKGELPQKSEYKKFKIRTIRGISDTGMIGEIILRRLKNNWPLPDLILVDGGKGQVNVAKKILLELGISIPILGIAKGKERKKNEIIGKMPKWTSEKILINVRDEAHRFAISYHRKRRSIIN